MLYVVIELRKTNDQIDYTITKHSDRASAESKFYAVLSEAAASSVPKHACSLITEDGVCLRDGVYEHGEA